ncbi:RNA methyltransferase [candidate division KSB1 bacterium]|nr:RNA methyltransferase [candidate division KSB1 bacterium]
MPILSNAKFKIYRSLKQKKSRERELKFLIEGIKFCNEAFNAHIHIDAFLYYPPVVSDDIASQFKYLCDQRGIPSFEISSDMVNALSDTVHSQGVFCVAAMQTNSPDFRHVSFMLAVDSVQEPGNLGTIIRTADWFGVEAILLGEGTVDVYNSKVLRSTMGSLFHLSITTVNLTEALPQLKQLGFETYAAVARAGHALDDIQFSNKKILVIGNESQGIRDQLLHLVDTKLTIPGQGRAESLNVAIASGIILNQMAGTNESI